jgi:hypothetical protein
LDNNNVSLLGALLMIALPIVRDLSLTTPFAVRQSVGNMDRTFSINVTAMFTLDARTNIAALGFAHSRDTQL